MSIPTFLTRRVAVLALGTALAMSWGCGKSGGGATYSVAVTGKIVENGTPLSVRLQEIGVGRVEVHLIPVAATGNAAAGNATDNAAPGNARKVVAKPDGTFLFVNLEKDRIAPGKYRIAVLALEPPANPADAGPDGLIDKLQGAFDAEHTPIEQEISPEKSDLGTIDLATFSRAKKN